VRLYTLPPRSPRLKRAATNEPSFDQGRQTSRPWPLNLEDPMKTRILLTGATLALAGWFALAPARMLQSASLPSYQVAQNERHENERYENDQWYQGQQGHWYKEKEHNAWQFRSAGLVCDAQGSHCSRGRYLPPNGQGMVNPQDPRLYWACNRKGHHCHWAPRPR
jgi:hypothetical protein